MSYKYCVVPQCTNTSIKTPEKLFVSIPKDTKIRKKWFMLARKNLKDIAETTNVVMCEDHFNLPEDMENYMQYHVMGSVKQVRMKANCLPSKFSCQLDRKKTAKSVSRSLIVKKQRKALVRKAIMALEDSVISTSNKSIMDTASEYFDKLLDS